MVQIKKERKVKSIKRLIASILLVMMLMPYATTFAAIGDVVNFRTVKYQGGAEATGRAVTSSYDTTSYYSYIKRSDNLGHDIRTRKIVKPNSNETIYCLDINQEFPPTQGTKYTEIGNFSAVRMGNIGLLRVTDTTKAKLEWVFNNIYIRGEELTGRKINKQNLLDKVFDGNQAVFDVLTDDDIEFVNQWVIWHFTSNERFNVNTIKLETELNKVNSNPKSFNLRKTYMLKLFNYLVANAKAEKQVSVKPILHAPKEAVVSQNGLEFRTLKIEYPVNLKTNIKSINVVNSNGVKLARNEYNIILKNTGKIVTGNIEDYLNQELIIRVNKDNITEINFEVIYQDKNTQAVVYKPEDRKHQPVVGLRRNTALKKINAKVNVNKEYDLALRKAVVEVNGNKVEGRAPVGQNMIDTSNLKNTLKPEAKETTAKYMHPKNPIKVKRGDKVVYKISVFNETTLPTKALEVIDRLPEGLKLVPQNISETNKKYGWTQKDQNIITTKYMQGTNIPGMKNENGKTSLYSIDLFVELQVEDNVKDGKILTNIASIFSEENKDRDSVAGNFKNMTEAELENYKGHKDNKEDLADPNYFYKGIEDDDDFEKLIVEVEQKPEPKEADLALKKYITKVNGKELEEKREPLVNHKALLNGAKDAMYKEIKTPVLVEEQDIVTYAIRVYNEGELTAVAKEIVDNIPEGLEFIENSEVNKKYGWEVREGKIYTEYLKNTQLNPVTIDKIDSAVVEVEFKVVKTDSKNIINIAEINQMVDEKGKELKDRDSIPGNNNLEEDDIDREILILDEKIFDLALKKFITRVNGENVKQNREPVVDVTPIVNGEKTDAKYTTYKNELLVAQGDTVTYTIRIYNEGNVAGYANEVVDYLPEGLEFKQDSEINKKYGWVAENIDGKTELKTTYLKDKLINALNIAKKEISYVDVEVETVVKTNADNTILKNIAEINKDLDANKRQVEDIDSTPGNKILGEDDIDIENLKVVNKTYDLALKKFITKLNGKELEVKREPKVDVTPLKEGEKDAGYLVNKEPIIVENGDIITYTIRVYNEGQIDGIAKKVKELVPEGLAFMPEHEINVKYGWKIVDSEGNEVKITGKEMPGKLELNTEYLAEKEIPAFNKNEEKLSYVDVEIALKVVTNNIEETRIVNIAEIKEDNGDDIDSTPDNNIPEEDDQDEEPVVTKEKIFDLALRKYIIDVNSNKVEGREPKVDVAPLLEGKTTARYEGDKNPVKAERGDLVRYGLRVYNEGELEGYAKEIVDNIPEGLEFVPENNVNKEYGWVMYDVNGIMTTNPERAKTIRTDYLSKDSETEGRKNIIKGFNPDTKEISYKEVEVILRVKEVADRNTSLKNIAEIFKAEDEHGNNIKDRDSVPGNNNENEDDIDTEELDVEIVKFDLSLVKFASRVNGEVIEQDRAPIVYTGRLKTGEATNASYTKPTNPVFVNNGDNVEYIIRVYNEGNKAGYASGIVDNIPEGLTFIPGSTLNKAYGWIMLDKDGNETEDLSKAEKILTRYLSKEEADIREEDTLIPAYNKVNDTIHFEEVRVEFAVTNRLNKENALRNIAEIYEHKDEENKDVKDIDSTPNNNIMEEDDQDDEILEMRIFDLALTKRVSQYELIVEGKRTVKQTGHTGYEDPKPIVKVDIPRFKMPNVDVIFTYKIKVINEGKIAGRATEIKDYVPAGLIFNEKENPGWKKNADGTITTENLAGTILEPGEEAEVTVVLRWDKNLEHTGVKENIAEISKDFNNYGVKDIDSTPGNNVMEEDDQDYATVALAIDTGTGETYFVIVLIAISIVLTGAVAVKKYVL